VKVGDNPDCLVVRVDPPVIGPWYGPGLNEIIVAARFAGESLFPIVRWPSHVHVARILSPPRDRVAFSPDDIEVFAWAEIYEDEASARVALL
jgi:hypothetical protein